MYAHFQSGMLRKRKFDIPAPSKRAKASEGLEGKKNFRYGWKVEVILKRLSTKLASDDHF